MHIEGRIVFLSDAVGLVIIAFAVLRAKSDDQFADAVESEFVLEHSVHLVFECLRVGIDAKALAENVRSVGEELKCPFRSHTRAKSSTTPSSATAEDWR